MHRETEAAIKVVRDTGAELLKFFRKTLAHDFKEDHSLLTKGDLAAHAILSNGLKKAFPRYTILSEEGHQEARGDEMWILDPIDGTSNFATGVPHFAISVALVRNNILEIGIVYAPTKDKMFIAERGEGAFLNGSRISVSKIKRLSAVRALIDPGRKAESRKIHGRIIAALRNNGIEQEGRWCAALDLCAVASGERDVFVHRGLEAWDIAAGVLMVQEAGGRVSDLWGNPKDIFAAGIIATNWFLHDEVVKIVAGALHDDQTN